MSRKQILGVAVLVVLALASVGLGGSASADGAWDGCPAGQFNLEQGCVLCQGGYGPQATGATSDHGYACYVCAKTSSAVAIGDRAICRVQQPTQPQSLSSAPTAKQAESDAASRSAEGSQQD